MMDDVYLCDNDKVQGWNTLWNVKYHKIPIISPPPPPKKNISPPENKPPKSQTQNSFR